MDKQDRYREKIEALNTTSMKERDFIQSKLQCESFDRDTAVKKRESI
jgi:hypothetical protein